MKMYYVCMYVCNGSLMVTDEALVQGVDRSGRACLGTGSVCELSALSALSAPVCYQPKTAVVIYINNSLVLLSGNPT